MLKNVILLENSIIKKYELDVTSKLKKSTTRKGLCNVDDQSIVLFRFAAYSLKELVMLSREEVKVNCLAWTKMITKSWPKVIRLIILPHNKFRKN